MNAMLNRQATFEQLKDAYIETLGPLHDVDWTPLVDGDDPEYANAMEAFGDVLAEAGWSWNRWFATWRRRFKIHQAARLIHQTAS
jgi:hypothetical protein